MKAQSGFTLVELVVTLVIVVLIMLVAVPFTQSWVNSASVRESKSLLQQAYSRARAMGLANANEIKDGTAAAYMCVANAKLYVQPITATTCGTDFAWTGDIKSNTSITVGTTSSIFSCMGLNNLGLPVPLTLGSTACSVNKVLRVTRGVENNEESLY